MITIVIYWMHGALSGMKLYFLLIKLIELQENNVSKFIVDDIIIETYRRRFEATQCWLYDYDGIYPPPNSTVPSNSPLAIEEKPTNLSTNNLENKDIEDENQSRIHGSTGSRPGLERSEFSSTFGLTEEETREFWDMILPEETGSGKN